MQTNLQRASKLRMNTHWGNDDAMIAVALAFLCAALGIALYTHWRKRNPKPLLFEAGDEVDRIKR